MALSDIVDALGGRDPLLPLFKAGESLTIQRSVDGQNVLMHVVVQDPSAISPNRVVLRARLKAHGVSSYADGRVAQQKEALDRLTAERKAILEIAIKHGVSEIVDILVPPTYEHTHH